MRNSRRTRPDEFIWFGAMDVTKAYKFIWFGDIHGAKTYEFTGSRTRITSHTAVSYCGLCKFRPCWRDFAIELNQRSTIGRELRPGRISPAPTPRSLGTSDLLIARTHPWPRPSTSGLSSRAPAVFRLLGHALHRARGTQPEPEFLDSRCSKGRVILHKPCNVRI